MFDAGVETLKLGKIVQRLVPVVGYQGLQLGFDIDDVYQVAVLIQGRPLQLHLYAVMMGVPFVFGSPIAANKKVLRDEVSAYGNGVHGDRLL